MAHGSTEAVSHDELAAVTGGELDTSLQNYFNAWRFLNARKYGFEEVRNGSRGLETENPNMTPDVIIFPGADS